MNTSEIKFTKNLFLFDQERGGIDNIYVGNIIVMHKLISLFHYELDDILSKNNDTINQEHLVYRINKLLFNATNIKIDS